VQCACAPAQQPASRELVGRLENGEFQTPVHQRLTPAGKLVELEGMRPQALALSPDGRTLVTSGQTSELIVLDAAEGRVLQRVVMPKAADTSLPPGSASAPMLEQDQKPQASYTGLIFSPDGNRIFLSDVNGSIKVFAVDSARKVTGVCSFPLPPANAPRRNAEIPAGLAVSKEGTRLYVVLNLSNRLAELDAGTGRLLRTWDVGVAPFGVVLAHNKAYVSNWGGRRPAGDSLVGPAGRGTFVRVDPVRHIASEGSLSIIDLRPEGKQNEISTGLHASALAVSPDEHFVVVANAGSDTLTIIDTRKDTVVETIWARQSPSDLFGAQPNGLAFDSSGKKLFVCNGTQNAVGVISFKPGKSKLLGLIPAGWFPGAVVFDRRHQSITVANIKGLSTGRAGKSGGTRKYNSIDWNGSISLVPLPSSADLEKLTKVALGNMRYPLLEQARLPARPERKPRPVPERVGEPSVFQHVVYIIKENRTYDQVLGDMRQGNGDLSLCIFGDRVTPNQHKLAREFVLLDNTYCCGCKSTDGHQWTDSAMTTEYLEKSFVGFPRSYPAGGDILTEDALAYSPAGFIWDDALAHGKTVRDYGEFSQARKRWTDPARKGKPAFLDIYHDFLNGGGAIQIWSEPNIETVRPFLVTNTVGWDLSIPDLFRARVFLNELRRFEQMGNFPHLTIIWLPNDHTDGTTPGAPTPAAQMADNDLAFAQIVEGISHSRFWKDTCIFAIEDDPQSGWDHVCAYRTTAYVVSPYTRRGQVISTQYNTTSVLRTIELILGLPPMNQMDATATPMFDCFAAEPNLAPFTAVTNTVPLDQMNPATKRISNRQLRRAALASARLPTAQPDQCPEDELNRILWLAMKGPGVPYPAWAAGPDKDD
jgi:YVTN family beta-propeller protein